MSPILEAKKTLRTTVIMLTLGLFAVAVVMFFDIRGIAMLGFSFALSRRQAEFNDFKKKFEEDYEIYFQLIVLELQHYEKAARNNFAISGIFSIFAVMWNLFGGEIKWLVCFAYCAMTVCFLILWRKYRKKRISAQQNGDID